ncbi:unnamed protein product (macronuclear) [Paramecium tetraurelia]|uniref:TOG domain-containing protein n=1 Tax=Paramecium tetraurelia TaxID=5888 RepID=A0E8T0_PARTE|nr:uncharacterized protein GSPATT00024427001 [Paramecium tetraurelia]CAK91697.1 unnamed protein product [Paramecium tetraurelia]|eukprot:XP_001459094.1 hypothetical protein (macronuclear) [Paramecium tetraurelia strain d4-2]
MNQENDESLDVAKEMLLVGLNNPELNDNIDKEWNSRRNQPRPKTALHDRRQQQLQELKEHFTSSNQLQQKQVKKERTNQQVHQSFQPLPQNKELGAQFVNAIEKFNDNLTRDSGVSLCFNLIEKNKDLQSVQTMIECLYSSSKKNINPKTNSQNTLAIDMELITLGEIIKQNEESLNPYLIDKIFQIIKKHMNSNADTTIQAISYVLIQLLSQMNVSNIYQELNESIFDKARQVQVGTILPFLCYFLKQKNKIEEFTILGQLIFEIFKKLMIDSLEFLKCIEFLLCLNLNLNQEIIIQRTLKYCQVPINKNSKYYLVVCQACKIIEHMGSKTRMMSNEVIKEMEKLVNDRRVDVQTAAKKAISAWKEQEIKLIEYQFDQFYNKIGFCQTPYTEYQKRGFQSLVRASSFVRKNSRSPSLPKKLQNQAVKPKIREKINEIRSNSPKSQLLEEDMEEMRRNQASQLLKWEKGDGQQEQKNKDEDIFDDSLETNPFQVIQQQSHGQQSQIIEQKEELQDSLMQRQQNKEDSQQLSRMPNIQYIDNVQTMKKSLHSQDQYEEKGNSDNVKEIVQIIDKDQQQNLNTQQTEFEKQSQIKYNNDEKGFSNDFPEEKVKQQITEIQEQYHKQTSQEEQKNYELHYERIQQQSQKVRSGKVQKQEEDEIEFEDLENNQNVDNENLKIFEIKQISNFDASIQEFPKEYISKNNNINYEQELIEDKNMNQEFQQDQEVIEQNIYERKQNEIKVKSGQVIQEENLELDVTTEDIQKLDATRDDLEQKDIREDQAIFQQKGNEGKLQLNRQETKKIEEIQNKKGELIENQISECNNKKQGLIEREEFKESLTNKKAQKKSQKKTRDKRNRYYFEQALNKAKQNVNEGYEILFENCDDLQKIQFMMMVGPQINKLNNKIMNKIIEFMNEMKETELLNVLGINLYKQIKECEYFDEINHEDMKEVKSVLYEISGSNSEGIGMMAVNIYNEL